MSSVLDEPQSRQDQARRFVLHGLSWAAYEKLLEALAEVHTRTTYDRGTLEFMSPLPIHELMGRWFGLLFAVLAEELDIALLGFGSTTFRREDLERGLEPDECFYLTSLPLLRDRRAIDLSVDPPPDLAIEIDVTRSSLNRLSIYGSLGIPEVWRLEGDVIQVHIRREDGSYSRASASRALPYLPLAELPALFQQCYEQEGEGAGMRRLRQWVRERVAPLRAASSGGAGS
jgi:Uma2 family endonuclease